jgi:multiple sugar transport system permease protein
LASVAHSPKSGPLTRARLWFGGFRERETWWAYLFISPWLFGFVVFTSGPMLASLYFSFTNYGLEQIAGFEETKYVGTSNYRELLDDPKVATSLQNTFVYTLMMVPATIGVALALALILFRVGRAAGVFRTIFYLPQITPLVAVGILFLLLFNGSTGIVNRGLGLIGIEGPFWTTDPTWIKPGLVLMDVWAVGGTMVILLAALHSVPPQLYEAAAMDGARAWRRFKDVTLPMISPALFFSFIILTIYGLNLFTQAYTAFFGAGQAGAEAPDAALFFNIYLFRQAFENFNMGFACAMAWLLFGVTLVVTALNFLVSRRFVFYQGAQR